MTANATNPSNFIALLLFIARKPSPLSLSARIPSTASGKKRTVTEVVMPDELVKELQQAGHGLDRALAQNACRFAKTQLYFVGPPIDVRKAQIVSAVAAMVPAYAEVRAHIKSRWDEIACRIEDFYRDYGKFIVGTGPELDDAWLEKRFSPFCTWMPWLLPPELQALLFTPEEQDRLKQEYQQEAQAALDRKVQAHLEQLVESLRLAAERVANNELVNRKTLKRIGRAYEEVSTILGHTPGGDEKLRQIQDFGDLLQSLNQARNDVDKDKGRDLSGLKAAVDAAVAQASPLLAAFTVDFGVADETPRLEDPSAFLAGLGTPDADSTAISELLSHAAA